MRGSQASSLRLRSNEYDERVAALSVRAVHTDLWLIDWTPFQFPRRARRLPGESHITVAHSVSSFLSLSLARSLFVTLDLFVNRVGPSVHSVLSLATPPLRPLLPRVSQHRWYDRICLQQPFSIVHWYAVYFAVRPTTVPASIRNCWTPKFFQCACFIQTHEDYESPIVTIVYYSLDIVIFLLLSVLMIVSTWLDFFTARSLVSSLYFCLRNHLAIVSSDVRARPAARFVRP